MAFNDFLNANPVGIGASFLQRLMQKPQQPNLSPEQALAKAQQILKDSGFENGPADVQTFVENNPDVNNPSLDFSNITPKTDEVKVPSLSESVVKSILNTPPFQVLSGALKPLQVLDEGFSRHEALKTSFLSNLPKEGVVSFVDPTIGQSLAGTAKTKFPQAKLRTSELPQLGDFFREMGVPEPLSAAGGLALDIATDIPIFAGIGALGKQLIKPAALLAKNLKLTEHLMKFRSNTFVDAIVKAVQGVTRYQPLPAEVRQGLRNAAGETNAAGTEAGHFAGLFERLATKDKSKFWGLTFKEIDKDKLAQLNDALHNINGPAFLSLDNHEKVIVKVARNLIDNKIESLRQELTQIVSENPAFFYKQAEKYGVQSGKKIPLTTLINIMSKNQGSYVKRLYRIFMDKNYIPDEVVKSSAIQGLIDDFGMSQEEAINQVKSILENKQINLKFGTKELTVKPGSFIARQSIPPYLRELMGEINDPRYNIIQTVRNLSENAETFKLYRQMKNMGLFSEKATGRMLLKVPEDGPHVWGIIDGLYTTPEVHDLLTHIKRSSEALDRGVLSWMSLLKGTKTIFNPKTHVHNALGNLFYFSMLDGVTPFNHPKIFKDAFDILDAGSKFSRGELSIHNPFIKLHQEAVQKGLLYTEYANSDQIKFLETLIKDPYGIIQHSKNPLDIANQVGQKLANLYSWEDQLFKLASYLHKTRILKQLPEEAVQNVYKWYPNYLEATKLADLARNSVAGLLLGNPFLTFRLEANRIMLNAFKDPTRRLMSALYFGHRMAYNSAVLAFAGNSMNEIAQFFLTRPEAVSEIYLNPKNPQFDLNSKYLDPFNTNGMFAPLFTLAGVNGIHPFEYLNDFTAFSPEFGYSQLIVNALEPLLTGKGKFNQDLEISDVLKETVKALGPSSFTSDLPKIINPKDEDERLRHALRFFGIDVEKRNPDYIKSKISQRLRDKVNKNEDVTATLKAIDTLGFNSGRMLKSAILKKKTESPNRESKISKLIEFLSP